MVLYLPFPFKFFPTSMTDNDFDKRPLALLSSLDYKESLASYRARLLTRGSLSLLRGNTTNEKPDPNDGPCENVWIEALKTLPKQEATTAGPTPLDIKWLGNPPPSCSEECALWSSEATDPFQPISPQPTVCEDHKNILLRLGLPALRRIANQRATYLKSRRAALKALRQTYEESTKVDYNVK